MEGLFFAVKPIWWEGEIRLLQVFILGVIIFFVFFIKRIIVHIQTKKTIEKEISPIPQYGMISIEDNQFEIRTLAELKKIIGYFYAPNHTNAHTIKEIGKYLFDSELIETGRKLETSIYTGNSLGRSERENIDTIIRSFLFKSREILK